MMSAYRSSSSYATRKVIAAMVLLMALCLTEVAQQFGVSRDSVSEIWRLLPKFDLSGALINQDEIKKNGGHPAISI